MQRHCCVILAAVLLLSLCGSKNTAAKWQEQYDLGLNHVFYENQSLLNSLGG